MSHIVSYAPRTLVLLLSAATLLYLSMPSVSAMDDPSGDEIRRIEQVNDGQLVFLVQPPPKLVHHHDNIIVIEARSLDDGWVALHQCHDNLDVFERVEIVFHEQRIRALRIVESSGIGKAWIEGASVQLEDVRAGAHLCLDAESRALTREADGYYYLRNGPFMRRFLDGYYPMHMTAQIHFPEQLRFVDIQPAAQRGMDVSNAPGLVRVDAWFEGRLNTQLRFARNAGL